MRPTLNRISRRGFLPKEVPPIFTSEQFGVEAATLKWAGTMKETEPSSYSLKRVGPNRRQLAILHPGNFFETARSIRSAWSNIEAVFDRSPIGTSRPTVSATSPRHINTAISWSDRPMLRVRLGTRARFRAVADISQCYSSLYTHSVTWSLSSKAVAKHRRSIGGKAPGHEIDEAISRGQSGQTNGIPIGPDTSLVIAELILSSMDYRIGKELRPNSKSPKLPAIRLIDDFEYFAGSLSEAEEALNQWHLAASEYQLQLNPAKTLIEELPQPFDTPWVSELSRYPFRESDRMIAADLMGFFSRGFELAREYPEDSVIKFMISGLRLVRNISSSTALLLIDLAANAIAIEPSALHGELSTIALLFQRAGVSRHDSLEKVLHSIARGGAPLSRSFEVTQSLFWLWKIGAKLDSATAMAVSKMDDNTSLIMLLLFYQSGNIQGRPPNLTHAIAKAEHSLAAVEGDWLLAYESVTQGWAKDTGIKDDPFLVKLRSRNISFLDLTAHSFGSLQRGVPTVPSFAKGLHPSLQIQGYTPT